MDAGSIPCATDFGCSVNGGASVLRTSRELHIFCVATLLFFFRTLFRLLEFAGAFKQRGPLLFPDARVATRAFVHRFVCFALSFETRQPPRGTYLLRCIMKFAPFPPYTCDRTCYTFLWDGSPLPVWLHFPCATSGIRVSVDLLLFSCLTMIYATAGLLLASGCGLFVSALGGAHGGMDARVVQALAAVVNLAVLLLALVETWKGSIGPMLRRMWYVAHSPRCFE